MYHLPLLGEKLASGIFQFAEPEALQLIFLMLQTLFEAIIPYVQKLSTKNGIAALRQEAFRADRHFSNASNSV